MKKAKPFIIFFLSIGIVLGMKFSFFPGEKKKQNENGKEDKKPATLISTFVVGELPLEEKLYASGTLVANEEVELKAEASGSIVVLNFPEGRAIPKGALLVKINDADIKAQFDKINIQLKLAEQVANRQRNLLSINGISQQEYDISFSQLNTLKADSAYYRAQLLKTEVRAPFNGVLGIKNVSVGSYLTPAVAVGKIQQINPIKIDFSLPEKYAALFKTGDLIQFYTEGNSTAYNAKIDIKDPAVDLNNRSVRYRALTANSKAQFLPGAFVRVSLNLKDKPNTLFVPTEAIVPVLKGKKVYRIENGIAKEVMVETGLRTEDFVQVLSGLKAGDSVAVKGNHQLKQGAKVKIVSGK